PYRSPDSTSSKYAPRPDRIYIIKNIQTDVKYISAPSGDNGPVRYVYAQNTDTGSAGNQPVSGYVFRAGIGTYEGLVFSGDYIGQDGNRDTFRSDNFKAVKLDTVINRPGNFRVMINAEYAVSVKKKSDHPSVSIFSIAPGIIYSLYPDIFPYISAGLSFINEARSDFSRLGILYRIAEGKPYYAEAALTGTGGAEVKTSENLTALFKLISTVIYYIIMTSNTTASASLPDIIRELTEIIRILREPGGCPWDRKQTHSTLLKHLMEEVAEVKEEIENNRLHDTLKEELCDLLLQVFLHAQIAKEDGRFDFYDIARRLKEKLIFRHPHVFGENKRELTEEELDMQWKALKAQEKQELHKK
ncbi:hypothetical protein CHS0354_026839, partial [Potamilus streckersoni]